MKFISAICFSFLCMVDQSDAMLRIANARNAYNTISRTFLYNVPSSFRWFSETKKTDDEILKSLTPTHDIIFKEIFVSHAQETLVPFINCFMKEESKISSLKIVNTEFLSDNALGKSIRLDILAETQNGLINIEVQRSDQKDIGVRTLFYWSKIFSSQLKNRNKKAYKDLRRTVSISILNFNYFDDKRFLHTCRIKDDEEKYPSENSAKSVFSMLEMDFLELKKIPLKFNAHNKLCAWGCFFNKPATTQYYDGIKEIERAKEIFDLSLSQDANRFIEYEKYALDYSNDMQNAMDIGAKKRIMKIVKSMTDDNKSDKQISETLLLTDEELNDIKQQLFEQKGESEK